MPVLQQMEVPTLVAKAGGTSALGASSSHYLCRPTGTRMLLT